MNTNRSLAAALVAAPVLWLAAEGFSPALKADAGDQLTVIAAHGDRWYVYTLLLLLGSIVFIPGIVGLAAVVRDTSPRLAAAATTLMGYGMVIACADVMNQFTAWKAVAPGANRTQMVELFARLEATPRVGLLYATGGIAFLVGAVVMTLALVRAPEVPPWSALGFGVAMVLQLVGFGTNSVVVIAASAFVALLAVLPIARLLSGDSRIPTLQNA